jgi:hypothetical protein
VAIQNYFGSMKNLSERSEDFLEAQDIFLEAGDGRSCKARGETMTEEKNKPAKTNGSLIGSRQ